MITFRRAKIDDAQLILAWRNHPSIRKNSFSQQKIDLKTHLEWFEKSMASKEVVILLVEENASPIGVVRFDLDVKRNTAKINIFLSPLHQGRGLGKKILFSAMQWLKDGLGYQHFEAESLAHNLASIALFRSLGFQEDTAAMVANISTFRKTI